MILTGRALRYGCEGAFDDPIAFRKLSLEDHELGYGSQIPFTNEYERAIYAKHSRNFLECRPYYIKANDNKRQVEWFKEHPRANALKGSSGEVSGHYWLENKETGEIKDWWFQQGIHACEYFGLKKQMIYEYAPPRDEALMIKFIHECLVEKHEIAHFIAHHKTMSMYCSQNVLAEYHKNPGVYNIRWGNAGYGDKKGRHFYEFVSRDKVLKWCRNKRNQKVFYTMPSVKNDTRHDPKRHQKGFVGLRINYQQCCYAYNYRFLGASEEDWRNSAPMSEELSIGFSPVASPNKKKKSKKKKKISQRKRQANKRKRDATKTTEDKMRDGDKVSQKEKQDMRDKYAVEHALTKKMINGVDLTQEEIAIMSSSNAPWLMSF
tara:strand:+ start:3928 stop:5058 length:1131 start_codon:yes stop_codon:yes gene_type:complete